MNWITVIALVLIATWFILPRLFWIGVKDAANRLKDGALLLDVRTSSEFKGMKLPGSRNVPLGNLERNALPSDQDILVYCASGARSAMAARQLKAMGYKRVWNLGSYGRARAAFSQSREN